MSSAGCEQILAWAEAIAETAGFITDSMAQAIPPIQRDVREEIDQKIGAINGYVDDIVKALEGGTTMIHPVPNDVNPDTEVTTVQQRYVQLRIGKVTATYTKEVALKLAIDLRAHAELLDSVGSRLPLP